MADNKGIVSLPASGGEAGLNRYLAEIKKFPILSPEEEYMLAKRWREHGDTEAAAKLVNSHLRLVAKIAMGYRGYGLPVSELISEGNIGLMQGVKKFEPDRGFRLATYAMWWIRASIQEFILRSWSGNDRFGYSISFPKGSSSIEHGIAPATPITLTWETFTAAADEAGMSSRFAGIHFQRADLAGRKLGRLVAAKTWSRSLTYFDGSAKPALDSGTE